MHCKLFEAGCSYGGNFIYFDRAYGGWENRFVYRWQVPLHNRVIDLVALNEKDELTSVEFKLKDWKRALEQARANSNAFDYVYVCLPGGKYLEKLKREANESGVGVMVYDENIGTIKVELTAKKVYRQWPPNIKHIKRYLEEDERA